MNSLAQWIGVILTAVIAIAGTAVNVFIVGRFVGRWSETMKNFGATLERVETRADAANELAEEHDGRLNLFDQRLIVAEQATSKFWEMRDAFTALRVTVELTSKQQQERLDQLTRGQSVVERQLGNLVTTRAGFTTLTTEDSNR